jgi:cytochrome c oxidase subunit 2
MERFGLPVRASQHAGELDQLNAIVHWLMLLLFIGWGLFFLYTIFRFRAKKNPKADYIGVRSHTSSYLEVAVAAVEIVLLVGFSIPLWAYRADTPTFPDPKEAVHVHVMGEQFSWNVHYPGADGIFGKQDLKLVSSENPMGLDKSDPNGKDDIIKINDLHLPVNKPVIIDISSKDVIHCFALQQMRIKHDAIPGSRFPVWFIATKTSAEIQEEMARFVPTKNRVFGATHVAMEDYKDSSGNIIVKKLDPVSDKRGDKGEDSTMDKLAKAGITHIRVAPSTPTEITCAQLCGLGHYRMRGQYAVHTKADFEKWLADNAPKQ